jgi:FlaA1/EpsC-like NDP-sugar epimerase
MAVFNVFDIGKPVKIVDLARKMIELAGYEPEKDIPITYTGLFKGERAVEASNMEKADLTATKKLKKSIKLPLIITMFSKP